MYSSNIVCVNVINNNKKNLYSCSKYTQKKQPITVMTTNQSILTTKDKNIELICTEYF